MQSPSNVTLIDIYLIARTLDKMRFFMSCQGSALHPSTYLVLTAISSESFSLQNPLLVTSPAVNGDKAMMGPRLNLSIKSVLFTTPITNTTSGDRRVQHFDSALNDFISLGHSCSITLQVKSFANAYAARPVADTLFVMSLLSEAH